MGQTQLRQQGMKSISPYKANLPREQFLFYEMRTTAKLLNEGLSQSAVVDRIVKENLYQYPTEKNIKRIAKTCISRLIAMHDNRLIELVATQSTMIAKQICLYAIMQQNHLVRDFMITVIGEKYRIRDMSFSKMDVNMFLRRLQEQDNVVAAWSETTIAKTRQVLIKILVENEYLDNIKSTKLNMVSLDLELENSIRNNNEQIVLPAFNRFL